MNEDDVFAKPLPKRNESEIIKKSKTLTLLTWSPPPATWIAKTKPAVNLIQISSPAQENQAKVLQCAKSKKLSIGQGSFVQWRIQSVG
jgi:hypothetical protein